VTPTATRPGISFEVTSITASTVDPFLWTLTEPPTAYGDGDHEETPVVWRVDLTRVDPASVRAGTERVKTQAAHLGSRVHQVVERWGVGGIDFAADPQLDIDDVDRLRADVRRISFALRPSCWIETRSAGQIVARSRMSLGGRVETLLPALRSTGAERAHLEVVKGVLDTRVAMVDGLRIAIETATALVAFSTGAGGVILVLPRVWRVVRSLLSEVSR
jgi:hypothetical protein